MKTTIISLFLTAAIAAAQPFIIPAKPSPQGTIVRTPDGKSYTTIPWGNGTLTRGPDGRTVATTIPWGSGTLTRTPQGKTYTTTSYGPRPQNQKSKILNHQSSITSKGK